MKAQDTIYVKNGRTIPAIIVEKNDVEIKYKRPGAPEPAAVYSVFLSDVIKIRYSDGIVADYTNLGTASGTGKTRPVDLAGTMRAIKFSAGLSGEYFSRNSDDDLLIFWQNKLSDPSASVLSNPVSIPINLRATFTLGKSARNWLGDELQLIITPSDAINASAAGGSYEIKLKSFYYNIIIFYGHTINPKKNLAAILEPGVDLSFMSGYIKLNNTEYKLQSNLGTGFHIAAGTDWQVTKRILATFRAGYRFMRVKESHKDESSPTGYSYFYVIPGVNQDQLSVKWNGPYAAIGLSWCMYTRLKL